MTTIGAAHYDYVCLKNRTNKMNGEEEGVAVFLVAPPPLQQ